MTLGAWLEDLTWQEAAKRIEAGTPIVVPIGAISKEHGHHLPLKTDWLIARALTARLLDQLPLLAAPIVCFGYYPAFASYPGSQHLKAETFSALLRDLLMGLIGDGATKLAVVNTGVSTEPGLRALVRDLYGETGVRVHTADIRALGRREDVNLEQALGGHGDEAETSMVLAIDEAAVRLDRARTDYGHMLEQPKNVFYSPSVFSPDPDSGIDYSATGVRGDPTLASKEKGERLLSAMTDDLTDGLKKLFPELDQ